MAAAQLVRRENWSNWPLDDPAARLVGGRCRECRRLWFPRATVCPGCLARDSMAPVELSNRGSLYSFSILHIGPSTFDAPYAVAYVDLREGMRVFGHLDGWKEATPRLGSALRIYGGVIGRSPGGEALVGVRFKAEPRATAA